MLVAFAALTLSAAAQGLQDIQSTSWYGGPGKSYIDRSTLNTRAQKYNFIINDKNSDIRLCIRKDGKKAWYSFNGGVHFMGYYDQSITQSEKKIIDKEKKKKEELQPQQLCQERKGEQQPVPRLLKLKLIPYHHR